MKLNTRTNAISEEMPRYEPVWANAGADPWKPYCCGVLFDNSILRLHAG